MPKKPSTGPSEADVIFTRASVALAKSQRLIASWLPPKSAEEVAREAGDEAGGENEEEFEAGNELLGIGATPPSSTTASGLPHLKRKDPSLDALRKQLLGRQRQGPGPKPAPTSSLGRPLVVKHAGPAKRDEDEDSEEDEGGRVAAFTTSSSTSRGNKKKSSMANGASKPVSLAVTPDEGANGGERSGPHNDDQDHGDGREVDEDEGTATTTALQGNGAMVKQQPQQPASAAVKKRKATSYLDEILAEKSAKKKKKKSKKSKAEGVNPTTTTPTTTMAATGAKT